MNRQRMTTWVVIGVLVCAFVAGTLLMAPARAAQASPLAQSTATPAPQSDTRSKTKLWRHGGKTLFSATASVTGLTTQEVLTELRDGKSLAQIAQDHGKTADDVIQAARTQLQDLLSQAVSSGRITQAQADAKLAEFDQTAPERVNDATLGQRIREGCGLRDNTEGASAGVRRFSAGWARP